MTNYAPLTNIISLEIDVSEKIAEENLKDFAFTSLTINNKHYSSDDLIYINYIKFSKQYQITLITNNYKYTDFQVFEQFYDKETKGLDVYLCDEFFCLYKDGLFYYYQAFEISLSIDDFLEFINRKFNTKINNYQKIEKDHLKELKEKYLLRNKQSRLKNINIKNNNSFKYYFIYILLLILTTLYLYINNKDILMDQELSNNKNQEYNQFKNKYIFLSIEKKINEILESIKLYNLDLLSFEYKKDELKLTLSSKVKEDLYLFLKRYKKELISSSVHFNNNKNTYEMIAYAKIFK